MIVGATILDLANRFMFQFHYQKMKPNLNLELFYSDTYIFIYAIKTDDVYRGLEKEKLISTFQITMRTKFCSRIPKKSCDEVQIQDW